MKLTVVLGASSEASFDIVLFDNSFTRKWVKELTWCLDNCEFEHQEVFSGLLTANESANRLQEACLTINKYIPNFIDVQENLNAQSQSYYNYLHQKFERLSGEFGKPTRLFAIANNELKTAIRNLNFFVHRMEKKHSVPMLYISFDKNSYRRLPLEDADYEFFEFQLPAGTLYLHYVELGKEFIDLYEDNLPIDYAAFKNLHFYSGEANLLFNDDNPFGDINYIKWLESNGVDPYNKKLGHGKIPLGRVEDLDAVKHLVVNYPYLNTILIKE